MNLLTLDGPDLFHLAQERAGRPMHTLSLGEVLRDELADLERATAAHASAGAAS